jgi:hypothetical protein
MALTEKNLGQAQLTTGTTTLYTVPSSTRTVVRDMQIVNTSLVTATVTVWIDTDGTSATDAEAVLKTFSIAPSDFLHWFGWVVMTAAATIKATASANSSISITVNGAEIT